MNINWAMWNDIGYYGIYRSIAVSMPFTLAIALFAFYRGAGSVSGKSLMWFAIFFLFSLAIAAWTLISMVESWYGGGP